jgi:hypothetical protein
MTLRKAIIIGQLWINLPIFIIIIVASGLIMALTSLGLALSLIIGGFLAWLYWSYNVPKWRTWAINKGVNPEQLKKWGQRTLLTWKDDSIFSKTEFHVRKDKLQKDDRK